jgi:hypothetical protein
MSATIGAPQYNTDHGWSTASATITINERSHTVFFRSSQGPLVQDASPFAILGLCPAMALGVPLRVTTPIPAVLLDHLNKIQDEIIAQLPDLQRIAITAPVLAETSSFGERGVACFFSAGVDSTFTVLQHQDEIKYLVFVHGFDVALKNKALRQTVISAIQNEAAELGKPLIEVETNARDLLSPYMAEWSRGIGPATSAIAYLLSPFLHTIYLASGADYSIQPHSQQFERWYRLFTTTLMRIVDDGRESSRFQKIALLAENETAMRWLRVCYHNTHNAYNCGRCTKCLHTMLSLQLLNALDKCRTLPHTVDLERVRQIIPHGGELLFMAQTLGAALKLGTHPEIAAAIADCLGLAPTDTLDAPTIELAVARRRIKFLHQQLHQVRQSDSWRLTAPLRAVGALFKRHKKGPAI